MSDSSSSGWAGLFNGLAGLGSSIALAVEGPPVGAIPNVPYPVMQNGQIIGYSAQPQNGVAGGLTASANSTTLILIIGAIVAILLLRK